MTIPPEAGRRLTMDHALNERPWMFQTTKDQYGAAVPLRLKVVMHKSAFTLLTGTAAESKKHYESHGGGAPAMLHQEIWLRTSEQKDVPIHLVGHEIPVRQGHQLLVIYLNGSPVAILNKTTEQYINLVPGWTKGWLRISNVMLILFASLLMVIPLADGRIFRAVIGAVIFSALVHNFLATERKKRRSTTLYHRVESEIRSRLSEQAKTPLER